MAKVFGATAVGIFGLLIITLNCFGHCSEIEKNTNYEVPQNSFHIGSYSIVKLREKRETSVDLKYHSVSQNSSESKETVSAHLQTTYDAGNSSSGTDVKQEPPGNLSQLTSIQPLPAHDRPLLGVNGTGQWKGASEKPAAKPAIVSEPIQEVSKKPNQFPKKVFTSTLQSTVSPLDELVNSIDVPENETLSALEKQNLTINQSSDHHVFYNSTFYTDKKESSKYWESFKNISSNGMLSRSHRKAMTVELTFDFPFYGNPVRNITVATGGFLYTGEYVHSRLAATQYIAPLMANFDTSLSNDSYVRLLDNGTSFTVIWENVYLQDKQDVGKFTFSVVLHKNGDIVFIYFSVPILIHSIQDDKHPVKVGLSDAYIIDKVIFFARRKTIYEYHRVNFGSAEIQNSTIIYLKALPTCLTYTDCASCINHNVTFDCAWCPILNRCSTGTDRKRQDWLHKGCDRAQITQASSCPAIGQKGNNPNLTSTSNNSAIDHNETDHFSEDNTGNWDTIHNDLDNNVMRSSSLPITKSASSNTLHNESQSKSMGLAISFMLPICLVLTIVVWVFYAYRNPHTKSGQLLIQYRPSQWSWRRRGEARYTAATIHM